MKTQNFVVIRLSGSQYTELLSCKNNSLLPNHLEDTQMDFIYIYIETNGFTPKHVVVGNGPELIYDKPHTHTHHNDRSKRIPRYALVSPPLPGFK